MPAITLNLSDATLDRLRDLAAAGASTPEAVAVAELEHLDADAHRLLGFAGSFASGVPDAAERHDQYVGQELARRKLGLGGE